MALVLAVALALCPPPAQLGAGRSRVWARRRAGPPPQLCPDGLGSPSTLGSFSHPHGLAGCHLPRLTPLGTPGRAAQGVPPGWKTRKWQKNVVPHGDRACVVTIPCPLPCRGSARGSIFGVGGAQAPSRATHPPCCPLPAAWHRDPAPRSRGNKGSSDRIPPAWTGKIMALSSLQKAQRPLVPFWDTSGSEPPKEMPGKISLG